MVESTSEQVARLSASKGKDSFSRTGRRLLYLVLIAGGVTLLLLLIGGPGWLHKKVYPWVLLATAISVFVVIPVSLLLAISKKRRGRGAIGLLVSSHVMGFSLWMWALILTSAHAGGVWLIVGLVLGGVGIVPVAFVATLIARNWVDAGQLLGGVVTVYAIRKLSLFLAKR